MKKRCIYALLFCLMLFWCGTTVSAEINKDTIYTRTGRYTDENGVIWLYAIPNNNINEVALIGCSNAGVELEIPGYIYDENGQGKVVTALTGRRAAEGYSYGKAFSYNGAVDTYDPWSLTIPKTVTYIGEHAFSPYGPGGGYTYYEDSSWNFLAGISIPVDNGLVIDEGAFKGCYNLQVIEYVSTGMGKGITLNEEAFGECPKFSEFTFPLNCNADNAVLSGSYNLVKVHNVPELVSSLYMGEDVKKVKLEEISYAEGVETVSGAYASEKTTVIEEDGSTAVYLQSVGVTTLKKVQLPSSVKVISDRAFEGCVNLTTINLPDSLEFIGNMAFYGCKNLAISVKFPAEQTSCYYQFKDSGITDITFSGSIKTMYEGAFTGCSNLKSINIADGHEYYFDRDGVLYTLSYKNENVMLTYPAGKSTASSYTIPSDVSYIGPFAFDSCKFTEVRIPVSVIDVEYGYMASFYQDKKFSSFMNMTTECPLYVVKNSYVDGDWDIPASRKRYMDGNPITITYLLDGGTNASENPVSVLPGETIKLQEPTKKGCRFLGWTLGEGTSTYYRTEYTPCDNELMEGVIFKANWAKEVTSIGKIAKIKLINAMTNSFTVTTPTIADANGYEIWIALNAKFSKGKKVIASEETITLVEKLKAGKQYYVKARAFYKTSEGVVIYGGFSKTASVKTISVAKVKKLTVKNNAKKKVTVTIAKVGGAKGYEVILAKDKKFKKVVKTVEVKKNKATFAKLEKGTTYYVRARAFKLNKQKQKVYGAYSKAYKIKVKK